MSSSLISEPQAFRLLLPYQVPVYERIKSKDRIGLLLDKRLGKCTLALRWAVARGAKAVLIIAPLSACPGWLDELQADGLSGTLLHGDSKDEDLLNQMTKHVRLWRGEGPPHFFVINPQGLFTRRGSFPESKPVPREVAKIVWDAIILDESPVIKNHESQINAVAKQLQSPCRAILSGEYAPEGAFDIFEQMLWCFSAFMGCRDIWRWRHKYFERVDYDWCPKKGTLEDIKRSVHGRCVCLTRKEAGLGQKPTFEKRYCELPPKLRKAYNHAEKLWEVPDSLENRLGGVKFTKYAFVVQNWLAQITGGYPKDMFTLDSRHKMKVIEELLTETYPSEPIVVSFRFNRELRAAEGLCEQLNIPYAALTGAVPPARRREIQKRFGKGIRVLLGQVKVLKYGIDLSAANTMIRYSLPPAYDDISQSMDRIVHPTKKDPLLYIDIVCRGTVDEDLVELIAEKRMTATFFKQKLQTRMKIRRKA